MSSFDLKSRFQPTGDQPHAISQLTRGVNDGLMHQTLLGVTGSGKTFSVANVIKNVDKPVLVISHNKTLAAQLYQEYRDFFPNNAVEYFVSYYDYYQPEAYLPSSDTYIEKDADINEDIERLRLSATTSLLTRNDVIVVASVSSIYNIGSPVEYKKTTINLKEGMPLRREDLIKRLLDLHYERNDFDFRRTTFRVKGDRVDVYLAYLEVGVSVELLDDTLIKLSLFDPLTGKRIGPQREAAERERKGSFYRDASRDELTQLFKMIQYGQLTLFPAKHYIAAEERRKASIKQIQADLDIRSKELRAEGKVVEAYRLEQKTNYDLELLTTVGYCKGIENYSRYFDGRKPGDAPYSLLEYFSLAREETGGDYLIVIDESHITIPQINGMYRGDQARKQTLIDYGFRLPSALDNRPLRFEEFLDRASQILYTSATPGNFELENSFNSAQAVWFSEKDDPYAPPTAVDETLHNGVVEQLIRPTGILDPQVEIRGSEGQIDNLLVEVKERIEKKERALVTTLTKRMAEDLSEFLQEQGIKVTYLHADVDTLDRSDILENLRRGVYDVVVGINLLREGLDLPEVSLVAILEADKEGFLRSETSLIQTMGRAARHIEGKVIMYADTVTGSMKRAIDEIERRRVVQHEYNLSHGIEPQPINKPIREKLIDRGADPNEIKEATYSREVGEILQVEDDVPRDKLLKKLEKEMKKAAKDLDFEKAAFIRDRIQELESE